MIVPAVSSSIISKTRQGRYLSTGFHHISGGTSTLLKFQAHVGRFPEGGISSLPTFLTHNRVGTPRASPDAGTMKKIMAQFVA
jgi:hypothetical protein